MGVLKVCSPTLTRALQRDAVQTGYDILYASYAEFANNLSKSTALFIHLFTMF